MCINVLTVFRLVLFVLTGFQYKWKARNRGHQGLAVAMLKLWEKTEIVKIAVKKRMQNTNNELMASEIRVSLCHAYKQELRHHQLWNIA